MSWRLAAQLRCARRSLSVSSVARFRRAACRHRILHLTQIMNLITELSASSSARIIMSTYVLVHGAWHTGKELERVAEEIKAAGHKPFTPTIKGNGPEDPRNIGLAEAIQSIVDYLVRNDLTDLVL